MMYKSSQGWWILAPSISPQAKLFCLRPASPMSPQGMDDACLILLQIVSKGFWLFVMGFLNLSCYTSTCSANLKTACTSDRSDESCLTPKSEWYLKGKHAASLICFLQVFSILILNFVSKPSNIQKMPCPTPVTLPKMGCFQDTVVQSGPDEALPLVKYGLYPCSSFSPSQAHLLLFGYCTDSALVTSPCPISAALNHSGPYFQATTHTWVLIYVIVF